MFSSFLKCLSIASVVLSAAIAVAQKPIAFCADPQNAPFSTRQKSGLENKIALAIGAELRRPVVFHWSRMGRGFIREVVNKGACDALASVPVGMRGVLVTQPYYRSTYVFVTRSGDEPLKSLDDPRLAKMKIGVQVLDDDYAPPARALARRGLTKNVVGFDMEEGARSIISDVASRRIDTAIVWGPLAGYYAKKFGDTLHLERVTPEVDPPRVLFTYEIAVGIRKNEPELYQQVKAALERARPKIQQILRQYNAPLLPLLKSESERAGAQ